MAGGLDVVVRLADGAIRLDQEGGADNALDDLAVVLLLPKRAVGGHDRLIWVREQREVELVVRAELRQRLRLIGRDTHDGDIEIIELFQGIAEIAGFLGAARGIGAGVEVDQYALACVIGEGNGVSGVVGKRT